jgi:hypothetical protein
MAKLNNLKIIREIKMLHLSVFATAKPKWITQFNYNEKVYKRYIWNSKEFCD